MAQLPPSSRTGAAFSMVACPHDERGLHRARQRLESTSFCVRDDMGRKLGVQLVGKINKSRKTTFPRPSFLVKPDFPIGPF